MAINLDYTNKTIEITSAYTMIQFYSDLMDTFDELSQMDDDVPIKYNTPTEYELINGWTFLNTTSVQFLSRGSVIVRKDAGDDIWANIYTLGTIESGLHLYVVQDGSKITDYWADGHIDILVKVQADGTSIGDGDLKICANDYGKLYDHFPINVANGGRNAIPIATSPDLNNTTAIATVAAYTGITFNFATVSRDLGNGNGANDYGLEIDCGTHRLSEVYEYLKWVTRDESTTTLNSLPGWDYESLDPDNYAPVKASPFGTFAGGTFFGARGVYITNYDSADANSFQLIDSAGSTQAPPNTVPIKITAIAVGDVVAVYRLLSAGGEIDKTEYSAAATGNTSGSGTFTVKETIKTDTPASGTVVINGVGYPYSSFLGSVFTLTGTLLIDIVEDIDAYVPFIFLVSSGTVAQTIITYNANTPVKIKVRQGKVILPFEVESEIASTGLSVSAIRTLDTVAV